MSTQPTIHARLSAIARELLDAGVTRDQAVEEFDRTYLQTAVDQAGNVTAAAQRAGVHRNTIHNRLRSLIPEHEQIRRRRCYARLRER